MSIPEQAIVVDAYEWVSKYTSDMMELFRHEMWHDLAMVDLVSALKQSFFKKIVEVEAAGTQLMGALAVEHGLTRGGGSSR